MQSLQGQSAFLSRMQWSITILMILLAGGFFVLVYRPQTQRLNMLATQIKQCRQELIEAQIQTTQLPVVEADVEQLKRRLEKFKTLPKQDDMAQFVADISQLSQQSSLKQPVMQKGITKFGGKLNEIPISLSFEGDFNNVFAFLRHTEKLQRLIRVPKINVKSTDSLGQVKAQLTMSIYYMGE